MKTKSFLPLGFFLFMFSCGNKSSEVFVTDEGAVNGYDVVAYFTEGNPVKGQEHYSYEWNGATWHFVSQNNLNLFKDDPQKYAPQFGGYCAYGTAEGHKAPTKPDAWTIVGDKLYFNYNLDVRTEWRKNQSELIEQANKNWPEVKKQ